MDFENSYNEWKKSHRDCELQKKLDEKWEKENEKTLMHREIVSAIFPRWQKLHKIDKQKADELIKKTKDLIVVLICQYNMGMDMFKDFEIKINATYKNSHLKKIK